MHFEPAPSRSGTNDASNPLTAAAALLESLRPHQWLKNLLVFVPLAAAHRLTDPVLLVLAARGFLAFSLCASAVYLFNDVHDRHADREHPHKRFRAIASGRLPLPLALTAVPVLIVAANLLVIGSNPTFPLALLFYIVLQVAYTLRLKEVILLDAFILATGYTLRVYAGELITGVATPFEWLLFCALLFLSLALLKRFTELSLLRGLQGGTAHARAYLLQDLDFVLALGVAGGLLAVQMFGLCLSASGPHVGTSRNLLLWTACVLLLYWISRMWLVAHRGQMTDDPLVFAITDRVSLCLIALTGINTWLVL